MRHAKGAGVIPRLAGQHRAYLEKQLKYFVAGLRADPTMRASTGNLTAQQIEQVAAFLGAPDNRRPKSSDQTEKSSRIPGPPTPATMTSHKAFDGARTLSRLVGPLVRGAVSEPRVGQTTPHCLVVGDTASAGEQIDAGEAVRTDRRR
jgi:hypothetical protein